MTCRAPVSQIPWAPSTSTNLVLVAPTTSFLKMPSSVWPSSLSCTGSPWSRKTSETKSSPSRWSGGSGSSGGNSGGWPRACCATRRETILPMSAPSGRSWAGGNWSTRSIVTPPRWRKRRIAPRDSGTANAAPSATRRRATASTSGRRPGAWRSATWRRHAIPRGDATPRCDARTEATRDASSGVGGQAISAARSWSSRSRFMRLPQPCEPPRRARLDGASADAERRSRLLLRELEEVAAREDEPRLLRQPLELVEQPPPLVRADRGFLGRGGRLARGSRGPDGQVLAPAGRPAAVACLVRHDPEQPGPQGLVRAEASERAPGLEEALLRRVLGVGGVAGDDVGHSECDLLVCADERLVRARVAALRGQDERPLLAWTALHQPYYTAARRRVPG